MTLTLNGG